MGAVDGYPTEIPGPATVLRLTLDRDALDFAYRPVGLRWQDDATATALTRLLTLAELDELIGELAVALGRSRGPLAPTAAMFTIVTDDAERWPLVLLSGGRSSIDGPYPVHLQLVVADGTPITRLLTGPEAVELLITLGRLRRTAPRTVAESLRAGRWWTRTQHDAPTDVSDERRASLVAIVREYRSRLSDEEAAAIVDDHLRERGADDDVRLLLQHAGVDAHLPTFEAMRAAAYRQLGDVADTLRSDLRAEAAPTREQLDARSEALDHIGRAKDALSRAAL